MAQLIEIDDCFATIEEGWINPKPFFVSGFLFRAHGSYRAAATLTFAGQLAEMFPVARACLEQAAYALHIGDDVKKFEIWLRRSDGDKEKQQSKAEFVQKNLRESIAAYDGRLADIYQALYERTIDFGAHPNEQGVLMSVQTHDLPNGGRKYDSLLLHGDGPQLDLCIETLGQIGIFALRAIQFVYPERYMLLGVRDRIDVVQKYFN